MRKATRTEIAAQNANLRGDTAEGLTARCRSVLARMPHGRSILLHTVPADVRELLLERGLVAEEMPGHLTPTPRAAGYTHDPDTFTA